MKVRAFFVLRWYGLCVSLLPWRTPLCKMTLTTLYRSSNASRRYPRALFRRESCAMPKVWRFSPSPTPVFPADILAGGVKPPPGAQKLLDVLAKY
jgi:hypothetical protein